MRKKLRLGEMLVAEGLLSDEQLNDALSEKTGTGLKLGQFLVRSNICRERDIVSMLSRQLRLDQYDPALYPLDLSLTEILPADTARRSGVIPVSRNGNVLRVATTDPLDIDTLDALEVLTNLEIEPLVCTEADFLQAYSSLYGIFSSMDDMLESVEQSMTYLG